MGCSGTIKSQDPEKNLNMIIYIIAVLVV